VAGPTLVFLYGPPAVGKLTVARAVAELTGFRVLHNHLLADPAAAVLEWGTPPFWATVTAMRSALLRAAATERVDVVFTYVYAPGDESIVEAVCETYEEVGGRISCVQLLASRDALFRRVTDESRREFGKPNDADTLREVMQRYHVFHTLPGRPSLTIDTEELSPQQAAERIVTELGLPRR
jgi:shikimate kinase